MKNIAELQIKNKWLHGEKEAAFQLLVQQYSPRLYRQIRHFVIFHEEADDILQETLIKVWKNLEKFRWESALSSWLYRIAVNECLQQIKKNKRTLSGTEETQQLVKQLQSDSYFDGDKAEEIFFAAIASLPEKQRLVFNMKYFDALTYEEMTSILGGSTGSLKASYHHAKKKIEAFISSAY